MKKLISVLVILLLIVGMTACGSDNKSSTNKLPTNSGAQNDGQTIQPNLNSNILVVNFSCTGNTKAVAKVVSDYLNADFYEIKPLVPYTTEDINYSNDNCRANVEQNDRNARPQIAGEDIDISLYDTVLLSFPIWWEQEPRIIDTFVEKYDLSGKTVACFCTSGSSGMTKAEANLRLLVPAAKWIIGMRFDAKAKESQIIDWVKMTGITPSSVIKDNTVKESKMKVQIGDYVFTATLEKNSAVDELKAMMENEPVVLNLDDYLGFEKVGPLGKSLTRTDVQMTTESGDIVLYNGNNIVMFYSSNSWSYTKLGKIDDLTNWEEALGSGSVTVTFSIEE